MHDVGSTSDVDTLKFSNLNTGDVTFSRLGGQGYVTINSTGSVITLDEQFYSATSTAGIDKVQFADGTLWDRAQITAASWVRGTSGNDTLSGGGDLTFVGGGGNDRFNTGQGSNSYVYSLGDGSDYIDDDTGSTTDIDTLKFTNLNSGDVTLSRAGSNAVVTVNSTGSTITLDEQFYSATNYWGMERIQFADGTIWDRDQILAASWIRGTAGDDTLSGGGNVTFYGGGGNDRINTGSGSNTFVYGLGDGTDYIDDESGSTTDVDTLKFTNLNASDVTFTRSGSNAVVTVNSTGNTITLDEQFYSTSSYWGIERVQFADGTVWDRSQVQSASWLRGTPGNDTIYGSYGNDKIDGGAGNDQLTGNSGADLFSFKTGFGHDQINDFQTSEGDVIEFSTTIFTDYADMLSHSSTVGSDVVIAYDSGNAVTLKNVAISNLHASDFHFV